MSHNGHDLRIHFGFPDHHKTERLVREAGEGAVRCLLRLWAWAGDNRHRGVLKGMDETDVAIASRWVGEPAEWIAVLMRTAWLDGDGTHESPWVLHDWEQHQPFLFRREERSEQAKEAASARWGKRYKRERPASETHSGTNAKRNAPTPTPTPTPKGGGGEEERSGGGQEAALRSSAEVAAQAERWHDAREKVIDDDPSLLHKPQELARAVAERLKANP